MSEASLGPSAFIVLGLLEQRGPATSYDLKRWADDSVGYFWNFPRSQLYAEPQRLVSLGLLSEQQETSGRRRRTFHLTPAGRAALQAWLALPAGFPELRDLGLLKLFFLADQPSKEGQQQVRALAAEQRTLHEKRLATYHALQTQTELQKYRSFTETLRLGLLYEEANIKFWTELEKSP